MESALNIDDLVWVKFKKNDWPGIIARPNPKVQAKNSREPQHYVYFFGSKDFCWVFDKKIYRHSQRRLEMSKYTKNPPKRLLAGIEEMEKAARDLQSSEESDETTIKSNSPVENLASIKNISEASNESQPSETAFKSNDSFHGKYLKDKLFQKCFVRLDGGMSYSSQSSSTDESLTNKKYGDVNVPENKKNSPIFEKSSCLTSMIKPLGNSENSGKEVDQASDKNISEASNESQPSETAFKLNDSFHGKYLKDKLFQKCFVRLDGGMSYSSQSSSTDESLTNKEYCDVNVPENKKNSPIFEKSSCLTSLIKPLGNSENSGKEVDQANDKISNISQTKVTSDNFPDSKGIEASGPECKELEERPTKKRKSKRKVLAVKSKLLKGIYQQLIALGPPKYKEKKSRRKVPLSSDVETFPPIVHCRELHPCPKPQPIDLSHLEESVRKFVNSGKAKLGVLGIGNMGRAIAKNLIHAGYEVTLWNRTPGKCDDFLNAGIVSLATPGDVAAHCDITFCCISDATYAEEIVTGNCGIIQGLEKCHKEEIKNKGYINVTTLNFENSKKICEAITSIGMKYLEVPMIGSTKLADKGTLLLLASGNRHFFQECVPIFQVLAKDVLYLGNEAGDATKMKLVHSLLKGTVLASLAEAMAVCDKDGLSQATFLSLLGLTKYCNDEITEIGRGMQTHTCSTGIALMQQQKEMDQALEMGLERCLTHSTGAAANEIFKCAMCRGYSEHDVSAVYFGVKY